MDIESLREYCLAKPGTTECFPFDETTLVFKVMGKIFAITGLEHHPLKLALKCHPERALELRETYPAITAAWHLNKKHWNDVVMDASLNSSFLTELIDHSYSIVVESLTRKQKEELAQLS